MRNKLVAFDGSTFFISDPNGDIKGDEPDGFFFADTRHLSCWLLFVDGRPLFPLTSRTVDYYSARIVGELGPPKIESNADMTVHRNRIVSDGVHEDILIANHCSKPRTLMVELKYEADFAELLDVKQIKARQRTSTVDVGSKDVTISYVNGDFRRATRIAFTEAGEIGPDRARFDVELAPHTEWNVCIDITCIEADREHAPRLGHGSFGRPDPQMPKELAEWFSDAPQLDTDRPTIGDTYDQSLLDLAALRYRVFPDDDISLPAAGLPWFMTLLGRDSVLASYMALPFEPDLARLTLETLARLQAKQDDPFRDAEPGKMPHEMRCGESSVLGESPYSPYYGSHDVTLLWLILLDEYERWSGDAQLVRRLEDNARAALRWMSRHGDLDGDGFLEYRTRSPEALVNHCWKDSPNSIRFADGRTAEGAIAACEVQGYAYDAMVRCGRLAREVWDDDALADELEADAAELRRRFRDAFWCGRRKHPALALDGDKQRVDSLTSNIGHLLWSGILDDDHAAHVAAHLVGDELFSGWGVRTMSPRNTGYNPIEYHNGTVWPHDTAIIAEGLRRYGYREEAAKLANAVLDAAEAFQHQLPELFAGFARDETSVPVEYSTASCPQAWSAGAPLLALRTLLGLDARDGELSVDPHLGGIGRLALRGVMVGTRRIDAGV